MKSNKTLKYTGIIQGVLIATLLLLAIWIQVTFCITTIVKILLFGQSTATTQSYSFSTLFLQPLHLSQACQEIMFYMLFLKLWILHRWYCPYISFTNPYAVKARWQTA